MVRYDALYKTGGFQKIHPAKYWIPAFAGMTESLWATANSLQPIVYCQSSTAKAVHHCAYYKKWCVTTQPENRALYGFLIVGRTINLLKLRKIFEGVDKMVSQDLFFNADTDMVPW